MTWEKALLEIESPDYAANMNVVSSMHAFFNTASKDPIVLEAYRHMLESGEAREAALGRIHDLSCLEVDRRYENPNDTPLAVFLWLTLFAAPDYVGMAADLVDRAPQCWYAKKLARRILVPPPVGTGNVLARGSRPAHESAAESSGDMTITVNPATRNVRGYFHDKAIAVAHAAGSASQEGNMIPPTAGDLFVG